MKTRRRMATTALVSRAFPVNGRRGPAWARKTILTRRATIDAARRRRKAHVRPCRPFCAPVAIACLCRHDAINAIARLPVGLEPRVDAEPIGSPASLLNCSASSISPGLVPGGAGGALSGNSSIYPGKPVTPEQTRALRSPPMDSCHSCARITTKPWRRRSGPMPVPATTEPSGDTATTELRDHDCTALTPRSNRY